MKTRLTLTLFTLILMIALHATIHAQQTVPFAGDRIVTVMTQNLYSGVDQEIFAVPTATSFFDLASKVLDVYNGYFARNFPARAERIAAEVAATRPDLIALQEAILVRTQTPPDGPATPATTVALDFVQILRSALAAKGLHYEVAVESPGFDAELPSFAFDLRHTEREVILARSDLKTADLKLSNPQIGNFAVNCQIPGPTGFPPITITRGWASIEAKIRGKSFRLVTTHLDPICLDFGITAVQLAEASELLAGPASTKLPLLVVGDFNSIPPTGGAYNLALSSGLTDVWNVIGLGTGWTCCQAPHLGNYPSGLDQRIDFVFFRGGWTPLSAVNVGQNLENRTASGLWPSDHAGVVAKLRLP
jgi:endonuclease/exonuclease/phosphatase family metal-dependent hydrolase